MSSKPTSQKDQTPKKDVPHKKPGAAKRSEIEGRGQQSTTATARSNTLKGPVLAAPLPKEISRQLTHNEWYHGMMPREEIETLLICDGDFLLRKTEAEGKPRLALSVFSKKNVRHILINYADALWCIRQVKKDSLEDLIQHHIKEKVPVQGDGTLLVRPIPRPDFYILHEHVEIKEKLGGGAFGDVHTGMLMRAKGEAIPVAIKKLKGVVSKKKRAEFIKESKIMRAVEHKNIVNFIGIAPQEDPLLLILELAPKGSLKSYFRQNPNAPTDMLVAFTKDACRGMCYLAGRKIIHRDLAARNCLLGKDLEVKISDFGLSVADKDVLKVDRLKHVPVKWCAPETLRLGEFTTKTDVWSFGVLIWEIFTRCKTDPFPGEDNAQARAKILSGHDPMEPPQGTQAICAQAMRLCFIQKADERPEFETIFRLLAPKETPP